MGGIFLELIVVTYDDGQHIIFIGTFVFVGVFMHVCVLPWTESMVS